jgi:hypothetical protein
MDGIGVVLILINYCWATSALVALHAWNRSHWDDSCPVFEQAICYSSTTNHESIYNIPINSFLHLTFTINLKMILVIRISELGTNIEFCNYLLVKQMQNLVTFVFEFYETSSFNFLSCPCFNTDSDLQVCWKAQTYSPITAICTSNFRPHYRDSQVQTYFKKTLLHQKRISKFDLCPWI